MVRTEKLRLDGEWYSSYLIGSAKGEWLIKSRQPYLDDFFHDQNEGKLYFRIVHQYLKEFKPMMYNWLKESQTPYGGMVGTKACGTFVRHFHPSSVQEMRLLLVPGSVGESAFRLCFGIMEEY